MMFLEADKDLSGRSSRDAARGQGIRPRAAATRMGTSCSRIVAKQ
ncbi:Uncharacterized protein pbN1_37580 [Aromatoleum bremense]|nr:Uncharacterized protein pbN1_37580 [Aromatoleum bremense]